MIHFFRFCNFYSFSRDTLLNMQAGVYKEHPEHLASCPDGNLLKALAIYGTNDSGKSSLISALLFYVDFVCRLISAPNLPNPALTAHMFSLASENIFFTRITDTPNLPTSMSMQFSFRGFLFEYAFTIQNDDVIEESFLLNRKVVFQKENDVIRPGKMISSRVARKLPLRMKGPVIGLFLSSTGSSFDEPFQAFSDFFLKGVAVCGRHTPGQARLQVKVILKDPEPSAFICRHMKAMGFSIEPVSPETLSMGTAKIILLLYRCFLLEKNGGVLLADDLTAFLHPAVSRYLIGLFQAKSNTNRQLIFTTHDTALLNREQFRRDEAAIVSRDSSGSSRLYTLADIRVRSDASFAKDYLRGKYGRLPSWEEVEDEPE